MVLADKYGTVRIAGNKIQNLFFDFFDFRVHLKVKIENDFNF